MRGLQDGVAKRPSGSAARGLRGLRSRKRSKSPSRVRSTAPCSIARAAKWASMISLAAQGPPALPSAIGVRARGRGWNGRERKGADWRRRGSPVGRAFHLLQQAFDVIEVEAGACGEGLGADLKGLGGNCPWCGDRAPERGLQRLLERAAATVGHLLDLRREIVIEREHDSYRHAKLL